MYADYEYYTSAYGGTLITAEQWPALSRRADAHVNAATYGRLKAGAVVTDDVRNACCAVAEVLARWEAAQAGHAPEIASENTDGYAITYVDAQKAQQQCQQEVTQEIDLYLPRGDPLRYAGV